MASKVVVTGATGLIGRYLCLALKSKGYDVVATSRDVPKAVGSLPTGVVCEAWDGRDAARLAAIINGAEAIVNLVGENIAGKKWSKSYLQRIVSSRLDAGAAVKKALLQTEHPPKVLVQASAIGIYGDDPEAVYVEDSPCGSVFLSKLCRDWEASVSGLPVSVRVVFARTGIVLARDGGAYPKLKKPLDWFVGACLGRGNQWFSWIHVQDEINALIYLIECDQCRGVYNLVAPNPMRQKDLLRSLAQYLHRPLFFSVPAFVLQAVLGEMAKQTILASQRVVPKRLLEAGFRFRFERAEQAWKEL